MEFFMTYETVTEASASEGEASGRGYVDSAGFCTDEPGDPWTLREIAERVSSSADVVEAFDRSAYCCPSSDWWLDSFLASLPAAEDDGEPIGCSLAFHKPDKMTPSSWRRFCRIVGATIY